MVDYTLSCFNLLKLKAKSSKLFYGYKLMPSASLVSYSRFTLPILSA